MRRPGSIGPMARLLLFAVTLVASACLGREPFANFEATTSPPDLRHVPRAQVRSTMWVLAAEANRLDDLLATLPSPEDEDFRQNVLATLERMRAAARQLDPVGQSSQHPLLNRYASQFIRRIEHAQRAARRTPPNYYMASAVSSSCHLCHAASAQASVDPAL